MATTQTRDESATKMPKARPAGRSKARDELLVMEEKFWKGDAAFYRGNVDASCLLAITGMVGSFDRGDIAAMATGNHWKAIDIRLKGLAKPADGMAMITYEVTATPKKKGDVHRAVASSGYVNRDGKWKMVFHQQTPAANST